MGMPRSPTVVERHASRLCDYLIADAEAPALKEFVRREVLLGTVRTIPAGRGRLLILPSDRWEDARPAPVLC